MDPKPTACPECKTPTPPNELAAYGRCEDCYTGDRPQTGGSAGNRFSGWRDPGRRVTKTKAPY